MKNLITFSLVAIFAFTSCIKDDFVLDTIDPELRITTQVTHIEINTTFQFETKYFNNVGQEEIVDALWTSADPSIIEITDTGLANALSAGTTQLSVQYTNGDIDLTETIDVTVGEETVIVQSNKSGTIAPSSFYELAGSFTIEATDNGILIDFANDYEASTALPGLYVYLSNNANSIANAHEIAAVETFSGAHSYEIANVGLDDFQYLVYFCKPFNVKVGDGEIE